MPPSAIAYGTGLPDQKDLRIGGILIGVLGPAAPGRYDFQRFSKGELVERRPISSTVCSPIVPRAWCALSIQLASWVFSPDPKPRSSPTYTGRAGVRVVRRYRGLDRHGGRERPRVGSRPPGAARTARRPPARGRAGEIR